MNVFKIGLKESRRNDFVMLLTLTLVLIAQICSVWIILASFTSICGVGNIVAGGYRLGRGIAGGALAAKWQRFIHANPMTSAHVK